MDNHNNGSNNETYCSCSGEFFRELYATEQQKDIFPSPSHFTWAQVSLFLLALIPLFHYSIIAIAIAIAIPYTS